MIGDSNPYQRYQQTRIETAGQLNLIIMLYDGAIRFINRGKLAMSNGNISQANEALKRAQDIIDELTVTLNPEAGEIAANLARLYEFVNYQLIQANIKKEPELLNGALKVLSTLRSAWTELQTPAKEAVGK